MLHNECQQLVHTIYLNINKILSKYDVSPTHIIMANKHIGILNTTLFGNDSIKGIDKFMGLEVIIVESLSEPIVCIL